MDLDDNSPIGRERRVGVVDRGFAVLTAFLVFVVGLLCLAGGIALSMYPNPKFGSVGNALAADLFLTLGITSLIGAGAWCFPRVPGLGAIADNMFKKLCVLAVALIVVFFVVLIVI